MATFQYWLMRQRYRIIAKLKTVRQPRIGTVVETRGTICGHIGKKTRAPR